MPGSHFGTLLISFTLKGGSASAAAAASIGDQPAVSILPLDFSSSAFAQAAMTLGKHQREAEGIRPGFPFGFALPEARP
jgi:hypothetical protein